MPTQRGRFAAEHVMRTVNRAKVSETAKISTYYLLVVLYFSAPHPVHRLRLWRFAAHHLPRNEVSGKAIIMSALLRGTYF